MLFRSTIPVPFVRQTGDDGGWVWKCPNCSFAKPCGKTPTREPRQSREQAAVVAFLREDGWTITATEFHGRSLWVSATHEGRSIWSGNVVFGTVGERGKLALKLMRVGSDVIIDKPWMVTSYLTTPKQKAAADANQTADACVGHA